MFLSSIVIAVRDQLFSSSAFLPKDHLENTEEKRHLLSSQRRQRENYLHPNGGLTGLSEEKRDTLDMHAMFEDEAETRKEGREQQIGEKDHKELSLRSWCPFIFSFAWLQT